MKSLLEIVSNWICRASDLLFAILRIELNLITMILMIFKFTNQIDVSWIWVFAPLWIPIILLAVVWGITDIRNYKRRKRENGTKV